MKPKDVGLPPKSKLCTKCGEIKPLSDYTVHGNGKGTFRRRAYCKPCHAKYMREFKAALSPKAKAEYRKQNARNRAMRRFGMTLEEYRAALCRPCDICGRQIKKAKPGHGMHLDHCHKTLRVRGTLCTTCNKGLGLFYDRPELLRNAASYLEAE